MDCTKKECHIQIMSKGQFSPVNKLTHTKSTQGRNLTGSARHIRDLIADIHKNIQIWNTLHLEGVTLLNNITQAKQDESYSEILQEQCDKLEIICDGLDDIVKNFAQIEQQMKLTASLETSKDKLFTTWPSSKFGQVAKSIFSLYSNEAKVKRAILEDTAHYYTESWKMLFLASWVHQPLLPENLTTVLESMLIESGHR
ncbi:cyclin-dependent kinase 2-interacting protein-like [Bombus vosnesenskii]|uniref:Cyclin-dependent kinase 2-interacting protein-like n=1 Tax=Bombus vosnesenskii TaxID=207650 RepID=A0A6J3KAQ7_9HYME|nr:cyclin-dependent kinase 2-interacting protein-like [Bombus vosnesenskii]XP_033350189.1 cyclin-dependent kinase 2-interacting protein-like [Bombus vosnesenskii]XP_050477364.1 cyclin-dependent kinase 2-interacting protein-like [Bombus huntii]XP_050477365.1 cyclin-dependent kinase 2-interacting protein-like [Bombus huntii]